MKSHLLKITIFLSFVIVTPTGHTAIVDIGNMNITGGTLSYDSSGAIVNFNLYILVTILTWLAVILVRVMLIMILQKLIQAASSPSDLATLF